MFFVYLARCADGSLYAGHTQNLDARERTHNSGRGGAYTAARRPVRIVYSESFDCVERALERERQLKGWTVHKKEALISGDRGQLKTLSKRRQKSKRSNS
jgi:predicted GIY-YIG superfamily endonuclease